MTAIRDLNDNFSQKARNLENWAKQESLLKAQAIDLSQRFADDYQDPKALVQLLQETQRLSLIFAAGLENDSAALDSLAQASSNLWKEVDDLPVDTALQARVGEQFLEAPLTKPGANILMRVSPYAPSITEHVVDGYVKRGENFDVAVDDGDWQSRLINAADEKGVKGIGSYLANRADRTEKSIYIGANTGEETTKIDPAKGKVINEMVAPFSHKGRSIDNFFTLTRIPTERDAEIDGMDYQSYLKLFFELCDQPWQQVTEAQEKLIAQFDAAKELRITNDDGTDLSLNIEGQTFANSVVKKNIPGSEIFSAPHRDGVNGTLVAKGRFKAPGGDDVVENMTLRFLKGEVVEASAEKGNEALQKALATDEGSRYPGEIGIGTNPWLTRHVMNGLLVEKIGGSFHIALGACYDYDQYDGSPVNVKNGNSSKIHWDITTMLKGHGGKMYLDGELIQENGEFLAPEYEVFNKGWEAVNKKERPDYWKERLKQERGNQQRDVGIA